MTALGWITLGGIFLVLAILADDWLARRYRKPLSQMKPDPKTIKNSLGMRKVDLPTEKRGASPPDSKKP